MSKLPDVVETAERIKKEGYQKYLDFYKNELDENEFGSSSRRIF